MVPRPSDDEPRVPEAMRAALRAQFANARPVPSSVDDAIHAAFDREVARPVRVFAFRSRLHVAAAAAVLVLLGLGYAFRSHEQGARSEVVREDFDRSGRVDVLDAYRLSLALRRGDTVPPSLDFDGDGRVDARDVDLVARRAVAVEGPR